MNKKQFSVVWIGIFLLVFCLGLKTDTVYRLTDFEKYGDRKGGDTGLFFVRQPFIYT
jgi:hypothetical protein